MPNKNHQAFLNAIYDNPEEKRHFGAWADKLEEEGHHALAHFIRENTVHHNEPPEIKETGYFTPPHSHNDRTIKHTDQEKHSNSIIIQIHPSMLNSRHTSRLGHEGYNPQSVDPADAPYRSISLKPYGSYKTLGLEFLEEDPETIKEIHDSLDEILNDNPNKYSASYCREYEKALKYSSNASWEDMKAFIHNAPHERPRYGMVADWLDDNGHTDLADFFRQHGYSPKHAPEVDSFGTTLSSYLPPGGRISTIYLAHRKNSDFITKPVVEKAGRNAPYVAYIHTNPNGGHLYLYGLNDDAGESLKQLENIKD